MLEQLRAAWRARARYRVVAHAGAQGAMARTGHEDLEWDQARSAADKFNELERLANPGASSWVRTLFRPELSTVDGVPADEWREQRRRLFSQGQFPVAA